MYKILKLLKTSSIISSYELLDFKSGKGFYYLKGRIDLVNDTQLFFREYLSEMTPASGPNITFGKTAKNSANVRITILFGTQERRFLSCHNRSKKAAKINAL